MNFAFNLLVRPFPGMELLSKFLGHWLASRRTTKQLVALVLANPESGFVKEKMLSLLPYWHFRSGDAVLFTFFGYVDSGDVLSERKELAASDFRIDLFVKAIEEIEAATSIQYTGRTMLVLTVAELRGSEIYFDYDWVLDFDIEGLINDGAISDVRVLFEDVIRLAKAHPADDALWAITDDISDEGKHEAFMGVAEHYVPFLKSARKVAQAHTQFRVRNRNRR